VDIGEVKQRYGHRVCLAGNINCGETLSEASVDEVVRAVKETIRKAGPGGGHIMMSSNSLHSSVKPANYRAMVEATRVHGVYPLDLAALA
jgi:uroporphyrinogen decarboxylase